MQMTWKQWRWVLLWAVNIVIIFAVWLSVSAPLIGTDYSQTLRAISRLGGLYAAYTLLVQLWLIGRAKVLEADFGLDRLTRIHRWNGFAAVLLVLVHVPTLLASYAPVYGVQIPRVLPIILENFEDTSKALIAELIIFAIAASSLVVARRKLKYQWWYYIHLLTYVAIVFAFGHQVHNGRELLRVQWFNYYWYGLFIISFAMIGYYRFFMPFWRWNKHRFRVARVEKLSVNVYHVYISGRNVAGFTYQAGQFAKYWFVARGFWVDEHPFTISIEPGGEELRITYKILGDFTSKLSRVPKGTPVFIDGPYGRFTLDRIQSKKVAFIAGGIGITPIRAMLGELAAQKRSLKVDVVYSAKTTDEFVMLDEIRSLTRQAGATLHLVASEGGGKADIHGLLTADVLRKELKTLTSTDFYICGPPSMMKALRRQLRAAGVSNELIHTEEFSLVKS